jgi:hypothetical protein
MLGSPGFREALAGRNGRGANLNYLNICFRTIPACLFDPARTLTAGPFHTRFDLSPDLSVAL